jgi:lysozyme family protein
MANFKQAFEKTLKFEGGYANDPDDHGGKTMYGITEAVARGEIDQFTFWYYLVTLI